ncbi:hypothetical protein ACP6H6_28515, partial [Vibrio harveyi]
MRDYFSAIPDFIKHSDIDVLSGKLGKLIKSNVLSPSMNGTSSAVDKIYSDEYWANVKSDLILNGDISETYSRIKDEYEKVTSDTFNEIRTSLVNYTDSLTLLSLHQELESLLSENEKGLDGAANLALSENLNDEDVLKVRSLKKSYSDFLDKYANGALTIEDLSSIPFKLNGSNISSANATLDTLKGVVSREIFSKSNNQLLEYILTSSTIKEALSFESKISDCLLEDMKNIGEYFAGLIADIASNQDEIDDGLRVDLNSDGIMDVSDPILVRDNGESPATSEDDLLSFSDLRAMDVDNDHKLTIGDRDFADIKIWKDSNNNNIIDNNELSDLYENGISSIDLIASTADHTNDSSMAVGKTNDKDDDKQLDPELLPPLPDEISSVIRRRVRRDPLSLDLNGDGVKTIGVNYGVHFDHDGDGFEESTGWLSKEDGFLAIDKNGNGKIDSGNELFGDNTIMDYDEDGNPIFAEHGFESLEEYDSNGDGVINSSDEKWHELKIWQDSNSDGDTQSYELLSMESAGVESIALKYEGSGEDAGHGNTFGYTGSYKTTHGTQEDIANLNFVTDGTDGEFNTSIEVSDEVARLANTGQIGIARSLHEAMMLSDELKGLVIEYSTSSLSRSEQSALLDKILFSWATTSQFDDYFDRFKESHSDFFGIPNGGEINKFDKVAISEIFSGKVISIQDPQMIEASNFDEVNSYYDHLKDYLYKAVAYETSIKPYKYVVYAIQDGSKTISDLEESLVNYGDLELASIAAMDLGIFYGETLSEWNAVDFVKTVLYPEGGYPKSVAEMLESFGLFALTKDQTDFIFDKDEVGNIEFITSDLREAFDDKNFSIHGNSLDNNIVGSSESDTIHGGAGNDVLDGGFGKDTLVGGEGDDVLGNASVGSDDYRGTGDRYNYKTDTGNVYEGGKGDDVINDTYHSDTIIYNLGDGHDTLNL